MEYDMIRPWNTLDPWQKKVLETEGDIAIRAGRQSGKSTVVSIKTGEHAVHNAKQTIMIISKTERQALLLFEKVLAYLSTRYRYMIAKGKDRPTRHKITLTNGSVIHSLPTGDTGYGIMGFTLNLLVVDEAAFIDEEVYNAIVPSLSAVGGTLWLLSTPFGRQGFFYEAFQDDNFSKFHVSSEDCIRSEKHKQFLERQKERLTKAMYRQWYLGEFVDELQRMFSDSLIDLICRGEKPKDVNRDNLHFLGVDVAHLGMDETTLEVLRKDGDILVHVENQIYTKTRTTETADRIAELDRKYHFKKIYIDARGVGAGVFDILYDRDDIRRRIEDVDNLKKNLDIDGKFKKKTNKELLYMNLLRLMHEKRIILLNDRDVKSSLKSIQYEETAKGLKIFGDYSHIVEGLIRAAWSIKDKHLKIYISYC